MKVEKISKQQWQDSVINFLYCLAKDDLHYNNLDWVRKMARYHMVRARTAKIKDTEMLCQLLGEK